MLFDAMQRQVYENSKAHGFWEGPQPNIGEKIALMHAELSEALEEHRAGYDVREYRIGENGKPEGFAIELADTVIRIMDLCGFYGIDLGHAIQVKHDYNKGRPHKHGKQY